MRHGQLLAFPPHGPGTRAGTNALDAALRRRERLEESLGRQPADAPTGRPGRRKSEGSPLPLLLLIVLGLVSLVAAVLPGHRDLSGLPAAERSRLYAETRALVETACVPPRSWTPSDYCSEQIRQLLAFPECDAACRELAQKTGHRPMK